MSKKKMMLFQQQQQIVDENMSNLTSASGEASVSSGNRTEIGTNYSHQYFAPPTQTQPPAKKKRNLPGNPDPDAEVIALSPKTLMATNRFICEICNKGFQRDQNLQLHRRGHNLPWKLKQRTSKEVKKKVYVCPEAGCVHHDPSRALGDLTGIKKHFCRKHGEKKWKCDKCSKRYAVQSDWKAHSKTCGTREYRCDCGTLFSRRDSFITHRAFCDALAEESARTITGNNPLLGSSSNINLQPQPHQFNSQTLHPFSLKKEQHQSFRPEIPPWLNCQAQPNPSQIDLSSSSSIFSTRLDQDFPPTHQDLAGLHDNSTTTTTPTNPNPSLGPTLPPYQPAVPSPHMSATALLQKAAQMGATMSSNKQTGSSSMAMTRPHHQAHVSAQENNNNFGLNLSPHEVEDHNNLMASFGNSSSSATMAGATASTSNSTTTAGVVVAPSSSSSLLHHMINSSGFEGTSLEDAFGGIFNSKKVNIGRNLHDTLSRTTTGGKAADDGGGGGGGEGLTRDFLGLRALSHSDILNIAGLGNTMNISREHHNQSQKPW